MLLPSPGCTPGLGAGTGDHQRGARTGICEELAAVVVAAQVEIHVAADVGLFWRTAC